MMNTEILARAGIDYANGIKRFLNDAMLYETVLEAFLEDDVMPRARAALAARDGRRLFSCVHEMKGAYGNADMTRLYAEATRITELVRDGAFDWNDVETAFRDLETAYQDAQNGIREAMRG